MSPRTHGWFLNDLGQLLAWLVLFSPCLPVLANPNANLTLIWDPALDPDLAGYNLYYGQSSRAYTNIIGVGNVISNTVSGLSNGVPYFFAVTAYNLLGLESDFSNEITYTPPSDSPPTDPNALLITSILLNPLTGVTVTWKSTPGSTYRVLYKTDLDQLQWKHLSGNITAVGPTTSWIDPAPPRATRFYQIVKFSP